MIARLYYLHALTAMHVGGGEGGGIIDLPFAREAATGLPLVPGSSIKGVWRDELRDENDNAITRANKNALFGAESDRQESDRYEGALQVGDARLLCLPVRAWRGLFIWVTCPLVLYRYGGDLRQVGVAGRPEGRPPQPDNVRTALVTGETAAWKGTLYLNDLDLAIDRTNGVVASWADFIGRQVFPGTLPDGDFWREEFCKRFVIVDDTVFDYLAETASEIRPRVALDQSLRTVKAGPWYEECLPAESLLWGVVAVGRNRRPEGVARPDEFELLALLPAQERLQIGGNATVGYGQTRWVLAPGA